jgi:hypothetical protein
MMPSGPGPADWRALAGGARNSHKPARLVFWPTVYPGDCIPNVSIVRKRWSRLDLWCRSEAVGQVWPWARL